MRWDIRIHGFGLYKSPESNTQSIKFNWKIDGVASADYTVSLTQLDVNVEVETKYIYHVDLARHFHVPPIKLEKGKSLTLCYHC